MFGISPLTIYASSTRTLEHSANVEKDLEEQLEIMLLGMLYFRDPGSQKLDGHEWKCSLQFRC